MSEINTSEIDNKAIDLIESAKLPVIDDGTYSMAVDVAKSIKALVDEVKATFRPSIEAAHKAHKTMCEAEKKHLVPLETAASIIKKAMADYQKIQEAQRAEAARIAREQAEEETRLNEALGLDSPAVADKPIAPPKTEGVSYREVWTFEVSDPSLVPREYLTVDTQKIGGVVRAMKNLTNIPGVTVRSEKTTVLR